ncbi:kelch domain-containing protein 1 isoform X2 [Amia ocellicauda]|uniref:kelch domain-containing protein 1 isoform X2 n=1 Tax=Amia ocellicauda TaxID=2972642 RepID=UPI003463AD94
MADTQILRVVAQKRSGHTAVVDGNHLYVWGGYLSIDDNEVYLPSTEMWLYDMDSGVWDMHLAEGDIPPPMSGTCGCCVNGEMYIFGGFDDNGYTDKIYCVNLRNGTYTWKKINSKGSPPTPRDKLSCWVYNDRIIYFGGYGYKELGDLNDSSIFTVDEASWVGDVFLGWNNEVHVFDPSTVTWNEPDTTGSPPAPRAAHACATLGSKGYVCGGRVGGTRTNDVYCLDLELWKWSEVLWHTACLGKESEVIVFGGSRHDLLSVDTGHCNDVLVFQTQPHSLLRLCADSIGKNAKMLQEQLSWLPRKLGWAIQKRISFFAPAGKLN